MYILVILINNHFTYWNNIFNECIVQNIKAFLLGELNYIIDSLSYSRTVKFSHELFN